MSHLIPNAEKFLELERMVEQAQIQKQSEGDANQRESETAIREFCAKANDDSSFLDEAKFNGAQDKLIAFNPIFRCDKIEYCRTDQ